MNMSSRLDKLEARAVADDPPVVIYVGGVGGDEFPGETPEEAKARHGIKPGDPRQIILVCYESETPA